MAQKLPSFSELPLNKGDPPGSAWGLYGKDDQLGTLNRLTDEIVVSAAKEIKTGTRISLDWPLDAQKAPFFGRQPFSKHIYTKAPRCVNDDTWTFNTQSSSQWDGLRHYGYQEEKVFYNGHTLDEFFDESKDNVLGIHNFSNKSIVGRGILVDYHAWRLKHRPDMAFDSFETVPIPLEHIHAALAAQGTEVQFGDILVLRTGYMVAFNAASSEHIVARSKISPPTKAGVAPSEAMLEWLWSNFSAVAGDHPAFEHTPMGKASERIPKSLHEVLISGWGMPIGELFDLDSLADHCHKTGRFSFFLTSKPCNVPGGVASPPNVTAIF